MSKGPPVPDVVPPPAGPPQGAFAPGEDGGRRGGPSGGAVTAVVLTHRRPRLAGDVVRGLLAAEGFGPRQVVVVVNGDGGLDDPSLESRVRMVRLPTNEGPGAGFRVGLLAAFEDPATRWAYLCEDDVALFDLPAPRVDTVVEAAAAWEARHRAPVGAVVAYGRRLARHGHTDNVVPGPSAAALEPVDVAEWGYTLVARVVVERGVLPDDRWFFSYEDFDFFFRLRGAGFALLLDTASARAVAHQRTAAGRDAALAGARPLDVDEPWRFYYDARNFWLLARLHGDGRWLAWHLLRSARKLQLARGREQRLAIIRGLAAGAVGRTGPHRRYRRHTGELPAPPPNPTPPPPNPIPTREPSV